MKKFSLALIVFAITTIYGLITIGFFNKNKILVTTLATTGPDFQLVSGRIKLSFQVPDSVKHIDYWGVMISENGCNTFCAYLHDNYLAFGDYFVLEEKVVGVKVSDGLHPHPMIEILSWKHIDALQYWLFILVDIGILICVIVFYIQQRLANS